MTTNDLLEALARLRVETGSLACLGCGHEHNCSTHGCQILREAAAQLEHFTAENRALRNALATKPTKRSLYARATYLREMVKELNAQREKTEAERDALLGELRKSGCTYCKYATVCVDELSVFGQEDCDRCGMRETCVCLTCSGYGSETDKWQWCGLPEAPEGEKT